MGKAIYIGVDGVARKVKKVYLGVDSLARKVKKGYIGVAGVARQFYSSKQVLSYYGLATNLNAARGYLAATTVGNYALFGGGNGSSVNGVSAGYFVDAYDNTLVHSSPSNLGSDTFALAATTVGNYALFGGGGYATVTAYDTSLAKTAVIND